MKDIIVNGESEEIQIPSWIVVSDVVDAGVLKDSTQALIKMGAKARDIAYLIKNMLEDSIKVESVEVDADEEYDIYYLYINLNIIDDGDDDEDYDDGGIDEDEDDYEESNDEFVYRCSCCEHPDQQE